MPECYVTEKRYWFECDTPSKPLHRRLGGLEMVVFPLRTF